MPDLNALRASSESQGRQPRIHARLMSIRGDGSKHRARKGSRPRARLSPRSKIPLVGVFSLAPAGSRRVSANPSVSRLRCTPPAVLSDFRGPCPR